MPGGDISTMTSGEITWLDADITAAEARGVTHTFVMDHGPIYPINEHWDTPSSSLVTVMNKHASISATFHGHEHVLGYAHIDSSRVSGVTHQWEEFVSGGAGAPLYSCTSGASDYCTSTMGFMTVDVSGPTFTVNLYFQGQSVPAETWSFTKSTPVVTITPSSASFGNQSVGTTSTPQALTVKNGTTGVVGVSIATTGASTTTAADGTYTLSGLVAGSYTVTATKAEMTFSSVVTQPIVVNQTAGSATGVNFTGTVDTYTIAGTVRNETTGVAGVSIATTGATTTTAAPASDHST